VDRHANQNGTARVMDGAQLKRSFQANFAPMDTVSVDLSSQDVIVLHGRGDWGRPAAAVHVADQPQPRPSRKVESDHGEVRRP